MTGDGRQRVVGGSDGNRFSRDWWRRGRPASRTGRPTEVAELLAAAVAAARDATVATPSLLPVLPPTCSYSRLSSLVSDTLSDSEGGGAGGIVRRCSTMFGSVSRTRRGLLTLKSFLLSLVFLFLFVPFAALRGPRSDLSLFFLPQVVTNIDVAIPNRGKNYLDN